MEDTKILDGKKLLVVDDEPDVLEVIQDLLANYNIDIDTAEDFETGKRLLDANKYDIAVLDIMGVSGYELLEIANQKGVPSLMLTANALTPDNFMESLKKGAQAYIPKEKMSEIGIFLSDLLKAREGTEKPGRWFFRLESFFAEWLKEYHDLRKELEKRLGHKLDRYDVD